MGVLNFNARNVTPMVTLDPVPENWYKVVIAKSNMKKTKDETGMMLALECSIIEGQYQGRVVYWNLNLFNASQQASEIAAKQLSAISHVTGVYDVADVGGPDNSTPMIHNIPFLAHVVVSPGNSGPMNNIRSVKDVNGNLPGKAAGGPPMQQPGQPPMQQQPQAQPGQWQQPGSGGPVMQPGGYVPPQQQTQPTYTPPQGQPGGQPTYTPPVAQGQWGPPGQPQAQPGQQPQQPPQGQPGQQWNGGQQTQPAGQPQGQPQAWQQPGQQPGQPPANAPWQR